MHAVITVRGDKIIVPVYNTYVPGNVQWIISVAMGPGFLSQVAREAMLNLRVRTVFSERDLRHRVVFSPGSRIALIDDMVEAMCQAGQDEAACLLRREMPESQQIFAFPRWTYKFDYPASRLLS